MTDAHTAVEERPSYSVALSLRFTRESEGGYTVTCKELPELITYGETLDEALENAEDAFNAVAEAYEEQGHELPKFIKENKEEDSDTAELLHDPEFLKSFEKATMRNGKTSSKSYEVRFIDDAVKHHNCLAQWRHTLRIPLKPMSYSNFLTWTFKTPPSRSPSTKKLKGNESSISTFSVLRFLSPFRRNKSDSEFMSTWRFTSRVNPSRTDRSAMRLV